MTAGAIILAGGRSSRMGEPKAWIRVDGVTLLERAAAAVAPSCAPLLIVKQRDQSLPEIAGAEVLFDPEPDGGPLLALAHGLVTLHDCGVELAYLSACDMPLLSAAHVAFVLEQLRCSDAEAIAPVRGGILEPLAAAVRVAPAVRAALELTRRGETAPRALYTALRTERIEAAALPDPVALSSCNTTDELRRLRDRRV